MDKMRVAPINKSSILFGKLFNGGLTAVIQVIIILLIGLGLGVNIASGILGVILILVLAGMFGIAWSGISRAARSCGLLYSLPSADANISFLTSRIEAGQQSTL